MQQFEQASSQKSNRRKMLLGIGILSLFPLLKFRFFSSFSHKKNAVECSPFEQKETMKFLTQEGKLVEVNISKIKSEKKKISDEELFAWIKKS